MGTETQLVAALAGLWGVLTAVVSGALKWLLEDRKTLVAEWSARLETERVECRQEISRRDAKLDSAADLMSRQAESQQKQIDSLNQMVAVLQAALAQGKGQEPP